MSSLRYRTLAITIVVLLGSFSTRAADIESAVEKSRRILRTLAEVADLPGLSASVAIDGRIVWSEGFGWADVEQRVPVTPLTRFRTGSIAKPLSAAVVAKLVEAGKIDIDSPIARYLPDVPDHLATVTVRQLAGHLAGVRHYIPADPEDAFYSKHFDTSRSALERFASSQLLSEPGKAYSYSTYGYTLLAAAVEGAAERDFGELLDTHVAGPLGLRSTLVANPRRITPHQSAFYQRGPDGRWRNAPTADISYKVAGGGLLSTSDDLVVFASALMRPVFLKQESLDLLFTPMKTEDGKPTTYGLGWFLGRDSAGRRTFSHGGGQIGCSTRLIAYPEQQLAAAVMCNIADAPVGAGPVLDLFLAAIEGKPIRTPSSSLEGVYDFALEVESTKYSGWLALVRDGDDFRGELVLSNSAKPDEVRRARVATAYEAEDEATALVLVSRENGAMRFTLHGDKAKIEIGGQAREGTAKKR